MHETHWLGKTIYTSHGDCLKIAQVKTMTTQVGPRQVKPGESLEQKLDNQIGPCRRKSLRPGARLHQQAGCKTAIDTPCQNLCLANGRCPCKRFLKASTAGAPGVIDQKLTFPVESKAPARGHLSSSPGESPRPGRLCRLVEPDSRCRL
jgi:hypothetical protein